MWCKNMVIYRTESDCDPGLPGDRAAMEPGHGSFPEA